LDAADSGVGHGISGMTTVDVLLRVAREALFLTVLVSMPVILASVVVGVVVSFLQAATQLQEQTLSFAPKLLAVLVTLALFAPWIGAQLGRFTVELFALIPLVTG